MRMGKDKRSEGWKEGGGMLELSFKMLHGNPFLGGNFAIALKNTAIISLMYAKNLKTEQQ